jgi:hypothetical protein
MPEGEYKLAGQIDGRGHYARVKVVVTIGAAGLRTSDSVFAWLKEVYGPDAWEWRDCDEMRDGAIAGAAYAIANRVRSDDLVHVEVTQIHAMPADTTRSDVAFAACMAVWKALQDPGATVPTLDQHWPSVPPS